MTRSRRALARIGAFAVLAVLLSACIKLDMNLTVNSDDTVDGTIIFALNKQLIELSGQSADDLLGDSGPIPTDAEGVSTKPYEDDEFQGQEVTLDAKTLTEEEVADWLAVMNDARLALGVRLSVSEETVPSDFQGDETAMASYALYAFLSYLVEEIVDALSGTTVRA